MWWPFRLRRSACSSKARWHYAKRYWYAPDRALDAILMGNRRYKRYRNKIQSGAWSNWVSIRRKSRSSRSSTTWLTPPAPTTARAFNEKTAILGIDGKGEYATTFFGYGENGKIHKIKEFFDPDSLGGLYGAITEFLGFEMLDGEFKVMGMAPYGDASKYDFSRLASFENGELVINTDYANVIGLRRYKEKGKGFYFSPKLIEWLGPKREGDIADEPYIHYAASMQALFEKLALADDRLLPGRRAQGNRQAGLRRWLCAERQTEPEDHRPRRRQGTVRPAGVR